MFLTTGWTKKIVVLLALLTLLSAAFAQGSTVRSALRPDAPAYGVRGPNWVGTRDLIIEGAAPLPITVWYPAQNPEQLEESTVYPYVLKMDTPPGTVATVTGHALSDAPYAIAERPYPLVILSSGFALGRTAYAWQAEHLASHGYVVIAPEHDERFDPSMTTFWPADIKRPQDTLTVLTYVDQQVAAGGAFEGLIDAQLVAVIGHSSGGSTALAAAGARLDTDNLKVHCDAVKAAADPSAWLCDLALPFVTDMAALAGLEEVPQGLWPTTRDDRIDAVVSMAGEGFKFGAAGLAEVSVPVMVMSGTLDTGSPYSWGAALTYDNVASTKKAMVSFENAEHMIFGTSCEDLPIYAAFGMYQLCSDHIWDMDRAHDLINHFTTAFLASVLNDDAAAAAALAPGSFSIAGVDYQALGY